jgi:hypothetical protein
MRKLIAAFNMTLDGFCNHTAMIADDEIHQHYNELLSSAGTLLYGRTTGCGAVPFYYEPTKK